MKLTKAVLRAAGISNGWGIARRQPDPQVYVYFLPELSWRAYRIAAWQVGLIGGNTAPEPENPWYNRGNKTFEVFYGDRKEVKQSQLEGAKAWASERYGIAAWGRSPFGSWHPAGTMDLIAAGIQSRKEATQ